MHSRIDGNVRKTSFNWDLFPETPACLVNALATELSGSHKFRSQYILHVD